MKVSDFDYNLPDQLIAKHPPKVRGSSNLLVLDRKSDTLTDKKYHDLVDYLNPGDVLILNDTKVIKARLIAQKPNGAKRELVILEKHSGDHDWHRHQVLYRRHLQSGDKLSIDHHQITVDEILGNGIAVVSSDTDLIKLADQYGSPPLPPYMKRTATSEDVERYQTVFARDAGSAAAPTASLNLTAEILAKLQAKGVVICYLTLHVGLGTFLPIRSENVEDHDIHTEYFSIDQSTIAAVNKARQHQNRVVALGTTVTRTLEYVYTNSPNITTAITGEANIFIYPGYQFKCVDALITNFHAPRSTVLMLAAAFAGKENLQTAYQHAIDHRYNFLSYGDSMLIL